MVKKRTKKLLWIWGLVILGIIILGFLGSVFLTTFPNSVINLGIRPDWQWDGNNILIHLEKSAPADTWNVGWDFFRFEWGNTITTGESGRACIEMGAFRDRNGEWSGGCGLDSKMNEGNVISKTATLNGLPVEIVSVSKSSVSASGFPEISGTGTLIVDVVVEIKCPIGKEKCSGNNLLVCENNPRDYSWFEDKWNGPFFSYVDKGIVFGKCGVECVEDINCPSSQRCELNKCEEIPIQQIDIYKLENNQCNLVSILESEKTDLHFETLEECEINIVIQEPKTLRNILLILGLIALIIVIIIIFIIFRKK